MLRMITLYDYLALRVLQFTYGPFAAVWTVLTFLCVYAIIRGRIQILSVGIMWFKAKPLPGSSGNAHAGSLEERCLRKRNILDDVTVSFACDLSHINDLIAIHAKLRTKVICRPNTLSDGKCILHPLDLPCNFISYILKVD